jgi:DNA-directed RNA polymerase sigma subunit (sigma70/sigma32)
MIELREIPMGDTRRLVTDTCDPVDADPFLRDLLEDCLSTLNPRTEWVMRAIYWRGLSKADVARELGIGHERVSQHERKGLWKLRHPSRIRKLSAYVEQFQAP